MESLIQYFDQLPKSYRMIWVFACLSLGWMAEFLFPRVSLSYKKWKHAGSNLAFLITTLVVNLLFSAAIVRVVSWTSQNQFGLFQWIEMSLLAQFIGSLIILDLVAQYFAHYLLHQVPFLWRFHIVHHSDTMVDATSGPRMHPIDFAFRETLSLLLIFLTGMPAAFYLMYRFATIFFTFFTHANIRLPFGLDRPLSFVLVSPDFHKFHHHRETPWTDSNYGNILSIWDRLFGTATLQGDFNQIKYGLDLLETPNGDNLRDGDVLFQLALPFTKIAKSRHKLS